MERIGEKGVSDVVAITFMLIITILAGVLLHTYRSDIIASATNRQLQLKAEYIYRTLETSQVENYSLSYLRAVAENLVGVETVVPGEILHQNLAEVLDYLRPAGTALILSLSHENRSWIQSSPDGSPADIGRFGFSGKITVVVAEAGENRIAQIMATLSLLPR